MRCISTVGLNTLFNCLQRNDGGTDTDIYGAMVSSYRV